MGLNARVAGSSSTIRWRTMKMSDKQIYELAQVLKSHNEELSLVRSLIKRLNMRIDVLEVIINGKQDKARE